MMKFKLKSNVGRAKMAGKKRKVSKRVGANQLRGEDRDGKRGKLLAIKIGF